MTFAPRSWPSNPALAMTTRKGLATVRSGAFAGALRIALVLELLRQSQRLLEFAGYFPERIGRRAAVLFGFYAHRDQNAAFSV